MCSLCNLGAWAKGLCEKHYMSQYYQSNKVKIIERVLHYQKVHKVESLEWKARYRRTHRAETAAYMRKRLIEDVNFKLSKRLRNRLYMALKIGSKSGSAVRDLGCSISQFRLYIENQFDPGMLWDNYGEWHLDHVLPLSSFDLTDRQQFLEACNWLNYQPLWAEDNILKGAKIA